MTSQSILVRRMNIGKGDSMLKSFQKTPLFFIVLSLFCANANAAPDAIGQVVWVKGVAHAISSPDNKDRTLQRRDAIFVHDSITTDSTSSSEIVFTDGGRITVAPGSKMKVDDYKFNKTSAADNKSVMSVAEGGFRAVTGAISKTNPQGYQVNTPVATIGVRGTDYFAYYKGACITTTGDRKRVTGASCGMFMKIMKGAITAKNKAGKIDLSAGGKEFARIQTSDYAPQYISRADWPAGLNSDIPMSAAKFGVMPVRYPTATPAAIGQRSRLAPAKATGVVNGFCIQ